MGLEDYMNENEILNVINRIYDNKGFIGIVEMLQSELSEYGTVKEHPNGLWEFVTGGWSDHENILEIVNHPFSKFHNHYVGWLRGGSWWFAENVKDYHFDVVAIGYVLNHKS